MFAKITMQESNQLHAVCLDTTPSISYMNRHTRTIIKVCQGLNKDGNVVAYSVDAGYHIFLFTLKEHKVNVKQTVE